MLRRRTQSRRWSRTAAALTLAILTGTATTPVLAVQQTAVAWEELPNTPSWTAEIEHGSGITSPAFFAGGVAVGTRNGVVVFPRHCRSRCDALWRSDLPSQNSVGYWVTAREGLVAVSDGQKRLAVFPADCRSDGGVCSPSWTAQGSYLDPTIHDGAVLALVSERDRAGLAVFPGACSDPCTPTWTWTHERRSWLAAHIKVANGVAYFVMNPRVYGLSLGCIAGGNCSMVFRARRQDSPTTPEVVGGRVVFASGGPPSEIAGFPEGCATACAPSWTGTTGSYIDSGPIGGTDVVYTWTRGAIHAWPIECADPCVPRWTARVRGYAQVEIVTDRWLVAVDYGGGRLWVFPADCPEKCEAAWSRRFRRHPKGVSGHGTGFVVAFDRRVFGFRLWCGSTCGPVWRGQLPPGEPWWPDLRRRSLLVYGRTSSGGVLSAFVSSDRSGGTQVQSEAV